MVRLVTRLVVCLVGAVAMTAGCDASSATMPESLSAAQAEMLPDDEDEQAEEHGTGSVQLATTASSGTADLRVAVTCTGEHDAVVEIDGQQGGTVSCRYQPGGKGFVSVTMPGADLSVGHDVVVTVGDDDLVAVRLLTSR